MCDLFQTYFYIASLKGKVSIIAPNVLKQKFEATQPLAVFHTDITQVWLYNGEWEYISSIIDEASREVISNIISSSPNKALI